MRYFPSSWGFNSEIIRSYAAWREIGCSKEWLKWMVLEPVRILSLTYWVSRPNSFEQLRIHSLAWNPNFKSLYSDEALMIRSTTKLVVQKSWTGRFNDSYLVIIVSYDDTAVAKVVDFNLCTCNFTSVACSSAISCTVIYMLSFPLKANTGDRILPYSSHMVYKNIFMVDFYSILWNVRFLIWISSFIFKYSTFWGDMVNIYLSNMTITLYHILFFTYHILLIPHPI